MKTFNKTIAMFLTLVFVSGLFPYWGFAQSMTDPLPGTGINRSVFDYHFSKADRELTPDRWLFEAWRGMGLALNAWEIIALEMFDTPLERDEYRRQVEKWSAQELEVRFAQWLTRRFFGAEAENLSRTFSSLTGETQLRYTYHLDATGNILREETTGDLRIVRPSDDGRDFAADLAAWREDSRLNIASLSQSFDVYTLAAYPELLAYIPAGERDVLGSAIGKAAAVVGSALKTEFEHIAAREERLFAARRTGDIYSLRKKSDMEEASYITAGLIEQARSVCDSGIAALQTRIEEASNGEGDLVLMGTEWLETYRQQFERGLKIWEEAEERFFIRRIEWEQESIRLFESGEEAWALAFVQFEEERQKWELQVKALFESGEELFIQASVNLENAIAEARIEFENHLIFRKNSGESKARALVDMYFTSVSAAYAAKDNAQYWMRQYDSTNTIDVTDESVSTWLDLEIQNAWKQLERAYASSRQYQMDYQYIRYIEAMVNSDASSGNISNSDLTRILDNYYAKHSLYYKMRDLNAGKYTEKEKLDLLEEARKSTIVDSTALEYLYEIQLSVELYTSFYAKCLELRELLINDYESVFGSGTVQDVLGGIFTGDYALDEYQIALARAKILAGYWDRRAEIARAVEAYAAEIGAGRLTEAESLLEWENAKSAYEASISAYEREMDILGDIGIEIQEKRDSLDIYIARILETADRLEKLNEEYLHFISANFHVDNEKLTRELEEKYSKLLFEYKLIMDTGDTPFYLRELELAVQMEHSQKYFTAGGILDVLINGDEGETLSLANLQENAARIRDVSADDPVYLSADDYGIAAADPRAALINRLIGEYGEKLRELSEDAEDAGIEEAEIEKLTSWYNGIIRELCLAAKNEAETIHAIRKMEIRLFADSADSRLRPASSGYGSADWYGEAWNRAVSVEERTAMSGLALGQYLYDDYVGKYENFIEKRLQIEIEALRFIAKGDAASDYREELFVSFCDLDRETAAGILQALEAFSARMASGEYWIEGNGEFDEIIARFISGESYFLISEQYTYREANEYFYARGLYEAFYSYAGDCIFVEAEEWDKLPEKLEGLFARYSTEINGIALPDITTLVHGILLPVEFGYPSDYIKEAASILKELDEIFSFAPVWLREEINEWKSCFIDYLAMYACCSDYGTGKTSESYMQEIDAYAVHFGEFDDFYSTVFLADLPRVKELNKEFSVIMENESLAMYSLALTLAYEAFNAEPDQNEKHWRMYLSNQYLKDNELLAETNSMIDGICLDIFDMANTVCSRINRIFSLYPEGVNDIYDGDILELLAEYLKEAGRNAVHYNNFEKLIYEFTAIGKNIDRDKMPHDEFMAEMKKLQNKITALEETLQEQNLEYFIQSREVTEIAQSYDAQYSAVKLAFDAMGAMRNEYDKQDAIRRWASTAYLDAGSGDLDYCEEKLDRANIVLDLLMQIPGGSSSFKDHGYEQALLQYERSYQDLLLGARVVNILDSDISKAMDNSTAIYNQYLSEIHKLGGVFHYASDFAHDSDKNKWTLNDIIKVSNGKLAFSTDSGYRISTTDQNDLDALISYFSGGIINDGEYHQGTDFQNQVIELANRMAGYFSAPGNMEQWGLARDYLVRLIVEANGDIKYLAGIPVREDLLRPDGDLGKMAYQEGAFLGTHKIGNYISDRQHEFQKEQEDAWNSLSDAERADLEFFVILALNGRNDYSAGFAKYTALHELQRAYDKVKKDYDYTKKKESWFAIGLFYIDARKINESTKKRIDSNLGIAKDEVRRWEDGIIENINRIALYGSEYAMSCALIDSLLGEPGDGETIRWPDIKNTIVLMNKFKNEEIALLETLWKEMEQEGYVNFTSVIEGVFAFSKWLGIRQQKIGESLDAQWERLYLVQKNREAAYREAVEAFMAGQADISDLAEAMEYAYGASSAAWKSHYLNIGRTVINNLTEYHQYGPGYYDTFAAMAKEYAAMAGQGYWMGLSAEFAVREAEWDEQRFDIMEKLTVWQETARQILEKGREDWKDSYQRMLDSRIQWAENFQAEYEQVSELWAQAYLAGLEDKEQWLERAGEVADNAMGGAFLDTIGSEAERFSRVMDTREFSGILSSDAASEARNVLAKLLGSAGISGMGDAFNAINTIGDVGAVPVRRGFTVAGSWDPGNARLEAAILSQEANRAIAARESRILANNARLGAAEALHLLAERVKAANDNFREGMDNVFIWQGQWSRNGDRYVKDIITGSTLFEPVIYERKTVQGYRDYQMQPVNLKTRLDDEYLEGLESFAIQALVQRVFDEVETIVFEIFGDGKSKKYTGTVTEKKKIVTTAASSDGYNAFANYLVEYIDEVIELEERSIGSGLFGQYIGYGPSLRPNGGFTMDTMFFDRGDGELGRLLTEFYYFGNIEARGISEIFMAPWDKRMWDDNGSIFEAPSLRTVTNIALSVVTTVAGIVASPFTGGTSVLGTIALIAAINSSGELMYNTLDVIGSYKSIDQAGFDFGKTLLINTASAAGSAVFGGVTGVADGSFFQGGLNGLAMQSVSGSGVIAETAMKASLSMTQTVTTGLVTSAISGVTYSNEKFGYSASTFTGGVTGALKSGISSAAGIAVGGALNGIFAGGNWEKLANHSRADIGNVQALNSMLGGLAGQGVNYLMGENFSINLLNTSIVNKGEHNSGLLELRIGQNGKAKMNIGTGGANVSPDAVWSAVQGAAVAGINVLADVVKATQKLDLKGLFQAVYSFGKSEAKLQLLRIFFRKDNFLVNDGGDHTGLTSDDNGRRAISINGYYEGMSMEEQAFLALVLGHESFRDVNNADIKAETQVAVLEHTEMAIRMLQDGLSIAGNQNLINDLIAYSENMKTEGFFNSYVDGHYDSSDRYWKLTTDGRLEYDGFATLRDANGVIIKSWQKMELSSDNAVEGALLWLLNVNQDDTKGAFAVRMMMEKAGLQHSFDINHNDWMWRGEHNVITWSDDNYSSIVMADLTSANMGKTISMDLMGELYRTIGATGTSISTSINRIYNTPVDYLGYAYTGGTVNTARDVLLKYNTGSQFMMMWGNMVYQNSTLNNGTDIGGMFEGSARRTSEFEERIKDLNIYNPNKPNEPGVLFDELHPGFDYVLDSGGRAINVPGGYWELVEKNGHTAVYYLYGGDLRMRIMHLDDSTIQNLVVGTIYGGANNQMATYPATRAGLGDGLHVHIELTRNLPYGKTYTRQYVHPETLLPGSQLEYYYAQKDAAGVKIPALSGDFNRRF